MEKLFVEFRESADRILVEEFLSRYLHRKTSDLRYILEVADASKEIGNLMNCLSDGQILRSVERRRE